MRNNDGLMWVPIVAMAIGLGLPPAFADFAEDSWQDRIYLGMLTTMIAFSYIFFTRIGNNLPKLKAWATNSWIGVTIFGFIATSTISTLSVLFAILPLPHWLHLFLAFMLALLALFFGFRGTLGDGGKG